MFGLHQPFSEKVLILVDFCWQNSCLIAVNWVIHHSIWTRKPVSICWDLEKFCILTSLRVHSRRLLIVNIFMYFYAERSILSLFSLVYGIEWERRSMLDDLIRFFISLLNVLFLEVFLPSCIIRFRFRNTEPWVVSISWAFLSQMFQLDETFQVD